ncbi:MAG TPA: C39 family peptidase [Balneolaceae bacterium]|nr:C39 family peptidase [Balneolaceae bacterium]
MLSVPIYQQPDETTCGPTCLHSIYQYYRKSYSLDSVINDVEQFEDGGTIGVLLANDALSKGFKATIYSYNLQIFDPTWFSLKQHDLIGKLKEQMAYKRDEKFLAASEGYIRFLELGGKLRFEDLRPGIIRRYLKKDQPVITGLSATFLYKSMREFGASLDYDDIRGEPTGHFVVLHGYDVATREVYIADPIKTNPTGNGTFYKLKIDRVINAILLGIVTYDANLIIITPDK